MAALDASPMPGTDPPDSDPAGTEIVAPSVRYARGVEDGRWQDDAAQRAALRALDRVHAGIVARRERNALTRWWQGLSGTAGVRGVYLWGGVGRGKTFLVDLLHDSLPPGTSTRLHFHRFMGRVHAELARVKHERDPLRIVAAHFAEAPLLCLDEFVVQDIGDAMILSELLRHLFAAGATLVTTSNSPPALLYRDGLQREKFMPAVRRIEAQCEVVELVAAHDYRLRTLAQASVYHVPSGPPADAAMETTFSQLARCSLRAPGPMIVNDRPIPLRKRGEGVAWFEFAALCDGPRAAADYIEIAKSYNTVLISNVPRFDRENEDAAKRFVHLVDEFYDRNVNLIVSAAAAPGDLYHGLRHGFEFQRTTSRLIEMQSADYLAREHRA
jgi:cell division protein ZapE